MKSSHSDSTSSSTSDNSLPRRAARELAFQFLYSLAEISPTLPRPEFNDFCENFGSAADDFAWDIVSGTMLHAEKINEQITSLSKNWRLERMPRVDLTILRLAAFEIGYREDIPKSVSINEAVELAKKFGSEGSPSFINGILDKFNKPA